MILTAWGMKLFRKLVVAVRILLYLFPDGRRENRLWKGWSGSMMMMMVALQMQCWLKISSRDGRGHQ